MKIYIRRRKGLDSLVAIAVDTIACVKINCGISISSSNNNCTMSTSTSSPTIDIITKKCGVIIQREGELQQQLANKEEQQQQEQGGQQLANKGDWQDEEE